MNTNLDAIASQKTLQQMPWRRRIAILAIVLLFHLLVRLERTGFENVPADGPMIVYFNHIHWLDGVAVGVDMTSLRYAVPFTKAEVANTPFMGWLTRQIGVVYVERGEADVSAIRSVLTILRAGGAMLVAPEGTRNRESATLQTAQRGLGLLARQGDAILLPVAVWGATDFSASLKRLRRARVHVQYGRAFRMNVPPGTSHREADHEITQYAMQELAALLPENMRGVYTAPAAPHPWAERV